eukprot:5210954-Prymnesium_polylepis.2
MEVIRAAAHSTPALQPPLEGAGYQSVVIPRATDADMRATRFGRTIAAIEDRVANLTGLPSMLSDPGMRLSVSRPWPGAAGAAASRFQNLHHDRHLRPQRVVTV